MDKQYKEWIQEQTFETLATDNYNVKLLLLAEQAKNKKLVEALELVKDTEFSCSYDSDHYLYNECKRCKIKGDCIKHQAQQALNEVNK